jgi:HSP20 family molecular chaperone IbpA
MKKPIRLPVGGHFQKHVESEKYAETMLLPVEISPDKAKSTMREGQLRVRILLAPQGKVIEVE